MEQEFNDQKHVTSVIVYACVSTVSVCASHRQLNKFTQENQSEQFQPNIKLMMARLYLWL